MATPGADPLADYLARAAVKNNPGPAEAGPAPLTADNDLGTYLAEAASRPRKAPPTVGSKAGTLENASAAKRQFLDERTEMVNMDRLIDGDSINMTDPRTGKSKSVRLGYEEDGFSVDSVETFHGDEWAAKRAGNYNDVKTDFRQKRHVAEQLGVEFNDVTPDMMQEFAMRGKAAVEKAAMVGYLPGEDPFIEFRDQGKGARGRNVKAAYNPITDENILDSQNTPELNSNYGGRYNKEKRIADQAAGKYSGYGEYFGEKERDRTVGEIAGDAGASITKAGINFSEMAYGAANFMTGGAVDRTFEGAGSFAEMRKDANDNYRSDPAIASQVKVDKRAAHSKMLVEQDLQAIRDKHGREPTTMEKAQAEGKSALRAMDALLDNPIILMDEIITNLPDLFVGGGVASAGAKLALKTATKGMTKTAAREFAESKAGKKIAAKASTVAAAGYVSVQEGMSNAVSALGDVMKMTETELMKGNDEYRAMREKGVTHERAQRIQGEKTFTDVAVKVGLTAAVISKVTGNAKFMSTIFNKSGQPSTLFKKGVGRTVANTAKGGGTEFIEEFGQSGAGELFTNLAKQEHADKTIKAHTGVGHAAGAGAITGAATGGGAGLASSIGSTGESALRAVGKVADAGSAVKSKLGRAKAAVTNKAVEKATDKTATDYNPKNAIDTLAQSFGDVPAGDAKGRAAVIADMKDHRQELAKSMMTLASNADLSDEQKNEQSVAIGRELKETLDTITELEKADIRKDAPAIQQAASDLSNADAGKHTDAARKTVSGALERMTASFGSEDFSVFDDIKDAETQEAVTLAKKVIATRKAYMKGLEKKGRSQEDVRDEVMGDEYSRWGKKGLAKHVGDITALIEQGDREGARKASKALLDFKKLQKEKYDAFMNAEHDLEKSGAESVPVLWGTEANRKEPFKLTTQSPGAARVVAKDQILPEIGFIEAQIAFTNQLGKMKFGGKQVSATPEVKATPVQSPQETVPDIGTAAPVTPTQTANKAPEASTPSNPTSPPTQASETPVQSKPVQTPTPDLELVSPPSAPEDIRSGDVTSFSKTTEGVAALKDLKTRTSAARAGRAETKKKNSLKTSTNKRKPNKASVPTENAQHKRERINLENTEKNLANMGIGSRVYTETDGDAEFIVQKISPTGRVTLTPVGAKKNRKGQPHIGKLSSKAPFSAPKRTAEQKAADEVKSAEQTAQRKTEAKEKEQTRLEQGRKDRAGKKQASQAVTDSGMKVGTPVTYKGTEYGVLGFDTKADGTVDVEINVDGPESANRYGPDHTVPLTELTKVTQQQETASPRPEAQPTAPEKEESPAAAEQEEEIDNPDDTGFEFGQAVSLEEMESMPTDLDDYAGIMDQQQQAEEAAQDNHPLPESTVAQVRGGTNTLIGDMQSETNEDIGLGQDEDGVPKVSKKVRKTLEDKANAIVRELDYVRQTLEEKEKHAFRTLARKLKDFANKFAKKTDPQHVLRKIFNPLVEKSVELLSPYRVMTNFAEKFSAVTEADRSQVLYTRMAELARTSYRQPDGRAIREKLMDTVLGLYDNPKISNEALNNFVEKVVYEFQDTYGFPDVTEGLLEVGDKTLTELFEANKRNPSSLLGAVPDFFSRMKIPEILKNITERKDKELDAQDLKNLDTFSEFKDLFAKAVNNVQEFRYDDRNQEGDLLNDYTHLFREGAMSELGMRNAPLPENVVSALAMSAINWFGTQARDTLNKPDAAINSLLGRDSKKDIEQAAYDMLQQIGTLNKTIIRDLGRVAAQQLNIKAQDMADGYTESKMEQALGLLALRTLENMKYIEVSKISQEELGNLRTNAEQDKIDDPTTVLFFSRIESVTNEQTGGTMMDTNSVGGKMIKNFVDDNYAQTVEKLFDLKPHKVFPNDEPGTAVVDKIQSSIQTPSEAHKKGLLHASQVAHVGKAQSVKLMHKLTDTDLYDMAGLQTDMSKVHVTEEKSTIAKNENIIRQFEHMFEFLKGRETNKPFYFDYKMIKNLRAYDTSNTITLQNSKIHRFFFGQQSWKTDVDLNDAQQKLNMEVAIAEAFGIGADKKTYAKVVKALHETVVDANGVVNPDLHDAVEAVKKALFTDSKLEPEERAAIVAGVKKGKEKYHTYDGLVALAQYSQAVENGDSSVKGVELAREIDGTTNGPISATIQMGLEYEDAVRILKAGGVHFLNDPDENTEYGEYIDQPGKYDNYQALAIVIDGMLSKQTEDAAKAGNTMATEESAALKNIMGNLLKAQTQALAGDLQGMQAHPEVDPRGRNLNKGPVMTSAYGAGMKRIIQNIKDLVVKNFYDDLMDARHDENKVFALLDSVNRLGAGPTRTLEDIREMIANEALQEQGQEITELGLIKDIRMNIHQVQQMENAVQQYYADPMEKGLEEQLGDFFDNRDTINEGLRMMNEMFATAISKKLVEFLKENDGRHPSRVEQEEIVLKLRDAGMFPMVMHPTSDKNDFSTYLEISVKEDIAVDDGGDIISSVVGKNKEAKEKNAIEVNEYSFTEDSDGNLEIHRKSDNLNSLGGKVTMLQYLGDIGISGFPPLNQSMDASVQAIAMQVKDMVNVFDAQLGGIMNSTGNALMMNETYNQLHTEWSMAESVQEAVSRMGKLAKKGDYALTKSEWSAIAKNMERTLERGKGDDTYSIGLGQFVQELNGKLGQMVLNKEIVMANVTGMDQYPSTGSIFRTANKMSHPTREEFEKATEEVAEAILDAEPITPKGSQAGGYADVTPNFDKLLEADKVQVIFNDLDSLGSVQESPAHAAYLQGFLDSAIVPAMRQLDNFRLFMGTTPTNQKGQMNVNAGGVTEIYVASSAAINAGTDMSAQEIYVHELTHGVWHKGIENISDVRKGVEKLYNLSKKHIKAEHFLRRNPDGSVKVAVSMAEELAAAQKRYDYIFDRESEASYLHEFATFGTSNEAFMAELVNVSNMMVLPDRWQKTGIVGALQDLMMKIVNWIGDHSHRKNTTNVADALQAMARNIQDVNKDHTTMFDKVYDAAAQSADRVARTALMQKALPWYQGKVQARRQIPKAQKKKLVLAMDTVFALPHYMGDGTFRKGINDIMYALGKTKDNVVYKLGSELAGANSITRPFHNLLRYSKKYQEQARENEIDQVTKQIRSKFENGENFTSEEWGALNDVGLKGDFSALVQDYTVQQMEAFLRDDRAIQREVENIRKDLQKNFKRYHKFYTKQAQNLGSIMARGTAGLDNSLLNAHNIVNLGATDGKYGVAQGDLAVAQNLVDRLATLHALEYTNPGKRDFVADLMHSEYARDPDSNGMQFMLSLHEQFKKDALDQLFYGQEALMGKGWTKEKYNEYKSMEVAGADQAQRLARDGGYVEYSDISTDPTASLRVPLKVYISNKGLLNRTVTGIGSRVGMTAKGANLHQQARDDGLGDDAYGAATDELKEHKAKALTKMREQFTSDVPLDFNKNYMIPTLNERGEVANYRYTMTETMKVNALGKDDQAHETMGRMLGSIIDKTQGRKYNFELMKLAKQDFDAGFADNTRDFIKIGANVTNEKHREIYRLLPKETVSDMENLWGTKEFYIREELVDLAFGFRKASLADWLDNKMGGNLPGLIKNVMKLSGLLWTALIGRGKKNIVLFTPMVLIGNVFSNILLSLLRGISPINIIKDQIDGIRYLNKFQNDSKELDNLKRLKDTLKGQAKRDAEKRISVVQKRIDINPVKDLVDEGLYQTLAEDLTENKDQFQEALMNVLPDAVSDSLKKTEGLIPKPIKKAYGHLTLSNESGIAQMLTQATQYSDFVARYALYKHLRGKKGMDKAAAIEDVQDTFINYDIPTSPEMQWMNDMGIMMYTKFLFRIQRVIAKAFIGAPASTVGVTLANNLIGGPDTIMDYNLLSKQFLLGPGAAWNKISVNPLADGTHIDDAFTWSALNYVWPGYGD